MITLEAVVARMMELETKYYELQEKYQGEYKDDKKCGHGIFEW